MLQSWVGGSFNRRPGFPFSYSERGDVWPHRPDARSTPALGRNDFGTIAEGLIAGTLVATDLGWQPVEDLQAGDRVVTFDNGLRPLKAVRIGTLWTAGSKAPRAVWPLEVPARALGNRTAIRLLPEQAVLIESDQAEELFGDPFTMVAAGTLDGFKGIARVAPERELTVVSLEFDRDEVVYASGTTLVHCPNHRVELVARAETVMSVGPAGAYQRLTDTQARRLVEAMHIDA